jgi:hypothetical protein
MGVLITVTVVHIHTSLPNADREGWKACCSGQSGWSHLVEPLRPPQLRSPVTRLGANPLTSVSVATVPTTRRRSTIHTPQEGPSLFPEQRLLLANASRGGGCQWCPLEKMSLKGT